MSCRKAVVLACVTYKRRANEDRRKHKSANRAVSNSVLLWPVCARADKAGEALLEKCVEAEGKLKTLQASFTLKQETGADTRSVHGTLKLQRPNRALITLQGGQASDRRTLASDGKQFTTYYDSDNEFQREPADPTAAMSGGRRARRSRSSSTRTC